MAEENQVTQNNQYVPKKYKRKHMWWRYLLVFVGGVLFTAVGAAAGAAIYSTQVPASQVVGLLPEELQSFMSFVDENDTIYSTVMKFVNQEITIDDILEGIELGNIITPEMVGEKLYVKLCYYKENPSAQPEARINYELNPLTQNEVTIPDGMKPINLLMLINGKIPDGKGGTVDFKTNLMNQLCLKDIMDVDSDSPLFALRDKPINSISEEIMKTKVKDLFGDDGNNLMKSIGGLTLEELSGDEATSMIYVADVLGVNEETEDQLMKLLCYRKDGEGNIDFTNKIKLSDLSDKDEIHNIVSQLNIEDVIIPYDESDSILKAIKGTSIGELSTKLSSLKLKDVINLENATGLAKGFLNELKETSITSIDTEFNNVSLMKALASEIYEDDGVTLKGEWKYMLFPDISGTEADQLEICSAYKISNFSNLIANMKNNMQKATLDQLAQDGFLTVSASTLNKPVSIAGHPEITRLGQCTILQVISLIP